MIYCWIGKSRTENDVSVEWVINIYSLDITHEVMPNQRRHKKTI